MPRWRRIVLPGMPLHVTHRGNDREAIFRCDHDFAVYRDILLEASRRVACSVHAYALMTNHVHILLTPKTATGAAQLMQIIGCRYVRYLNQRYHRTGSRWEGRFKSSPVDSAPYLLRCSRYIDLNPVRAGLVARPEMYAWSSYRYLAHGYSDELITAHESYLRLGNDAPSRRSAYRGLVDDVLADRSTPAIRRAALAGTALGKARFCARLEAELARPVTRLAHGGDRRSNSFRALREARTTA
jgi:putative transposase